MYLISKSTIQLLTEIKKRKEQKTKKYKNSKSRESCFYVHLSVQTFRSHEPI